MVISEPVFITPQEASQKFGYSIGAIYQLVSQKRVYSKNINGRMYVSEQDVETRFNKYKTSIGPRPKKKKKVVKPIIKEVELKKAPVSSKTTSTSLLQLVVNILAGILGTVVGFLIAYFLK